MEQDKSKSRMSKKGGSDMSARLSQRLYACFSESQLLIPNELIGSVRNTVEDIGRREEIKRKKGPSVMETVWENRHGVLDGDPTVPGYYLATRWSCSDSGPRSLAAIAGMWNARSVEEGQGLLGRVETSWNWVLADASGSIAYQMSGLMPRRREGWNGFYPVPGWKPENDWGPWVDPEELPRALNPPEGLFITTNQNLNEWGKLNPINLSMAPYRTERIRELLVDRSDLRVEEMQSIQLDVLSTEARRFMEILRPLLPATAGGEVLRRWDLRYDVDSRGAFLFEAFYRALRRIVFGRHGVGERVVDFLADETGIFIDFYGFVDGILLSQRSAWFGGKSREELFREALAEALKSKPRRWGESRRFALSHILFGGKLPRFLGFDRGPFELRGGRATVHQGQLYRNAGRVTSFAPSQRFMTDLAEAFCHTALAGGASDRRFSRWYAAGLREWYRGEYKVLAPETAQEDRRSL